MSAAVNAAGGELQSSQTMQSIITLTLLAFALRASAAITLTTVLKTGDTAPGFSDLTIADVGMPVINNAGDVAFRVTLSGTGVTTQTDTAIYSGHPGALVPAVREGDTAFGGTALFGPFDDRLILTDTGEVLFSGSLTGPGITTANDRFLAHGFTGGPFLVAQEGDAIPNTTLQITGSGLDIPGNGPEFFAQDDGQVAFGTKLSDSLAPGVTADAILAFDPTSGLLVIVKTNDVAPGTLGTFAQTGFFGTPVDPVGFGPDGALIFEGSGTDGTTSFNGIFDSLGGGAPITARRVLNEKAVGLKKNRGIAEFNFPSSSPGGLVIFSGSLNDTKAGVPLFNEIAQFVDKGPGSTATAIAVRDKPSGSGGGQVFSDFLGCSINQDGDSIFEAALFKRPNGLNPPFDQGTFEVTNTKRRPLLLAGNIISMEDGTDLRPASRTFLNPSVADQFTIFGTFIEAGVNPPPSAVNAIVNVDDSGKKTVRTVVAIEGKEVATTTGTETVTSIPTPTVPHGSAGQARIVNHSAATVAKLVTGATAGIYVLPSPRPPQPVYQPDIIYNAAKKIGDDVHQASPAAPQTPAVTMTNNIEETYIFTVQNDGNIADTIAFSSSDPKNQFTYKWFSVPDAGADVEITDAVLGAGQTFSLAPGESVKLKLKVNFVEIRARKGTAKIKMKAVSTVDPKKAKDTFLFTVTSNPP